jgi:hypothetical protein
MNKSLQSRAFEVKDPLEAIEFYFQKGWTDGLPVVPPTENKILEMLDYVKKEPNEIIGEIPVRRRTITAEKIAINAVMAGCLPAYMPVIVAAVEALCEPSFSVHGPMTSTSGMGMLLIINGPIAEDLNMNAGENLFGPGCRANATIGRTIRLILMNVCGAIPGILDRSTLGHPGKYSYCIAENEAISPWEPLHVERGFLKEMSAVTVFAADSPHQVFNALSRTPEGILTTLADVMGNLGRLTVSGSGEFVVIIGQEHMKQISGAGWAKADIRSFLAQKAQRSIADMKRCGRMPGEIKPEDEKVFRPIVQTLDDILVVAAGGAASGVSAVITGWTGGPNSRAVTKPVVR